MLTVIHGENQVASRHKLSDLVTAAKKQNQEIVTLEAEKMDRAKLESTLLSDSLFGGSKTLVIEGMHSLPKSKKKDEFIDLISSASIDIILWEKKSLTKTDFKKLPSTVTIFEFKITVKLWTLLDHLTTNPKNKTALLKLFRESVQSDGTEFVFLMITRQIRSLIQVKENQTDKMAPFMLSKLKAQAKEFTLEKLLKLHHQLYEIDQKQKQSTSLLGLDGELDLFLFNM